MADVATAPHARSRRLIAVRLGTKLTIAFGAVTLLPLVPLTLVAREVIGNRYRQELQRQVEDAASQTEHAYDEGVQLLTRTAQRLADPADVLSRAALASGTAQGRAELSEQAAQEARTRGLDVLVVSDAAGVVLAAPGDPSSEGQRDTRQHEGRAHIVEERPRFVRKGPGRLALEVTRPLAENRRLTVGVWLDELLPERVGPQVERLIRPESKAPSGAIVRHVELEGGSEDVPVELRAIDRTLSSAMHDLTLAGIALSLGGAVLAMIAGAQVARRITAPLDQLAQGADAIARGERELRVPVTTRDEVGMLTQRFNEMVGTIADTEQSARRHERAAAWRQMAQHLAHELKNPLTPIQMSIETLQRTRKRPDRAADFDKLFDESAHVILAEVARLKTIVGEFSRFARLPAPTFAPVRLDNLCEAAAKLYEGSVHIERQLTSGLPPARADRDQLQQILVNLLENAREASPGGHVAIRTSMRGSHVFFAVLDDGPGIAEGVQLFTPYATTKPGGSGLGLALVQRIVTEHGGRIEVVEGLPREGGHGAGFEVSLPVAAT